MRLADRLLTIVVTATLTSAAWILFGSFYLQSPRADQTKAVPATASSPGQLASPGPSAAATVAAGAAASPGSLMIPVAGVAPDKLSDNFNDTRGGHRHGALDIMRSI